VKVVKWLEVDAVKGKRQYRHTEYAQGTGMAQ